ncbi:MAG: energy transducer TonB [Desulfomonilaceae bacterium]|nr:energy transducer TonB [Desulfomonilaceae bacterium]
MSDDIDERVLHGYSEDEEDYVPEGLMRRSEILTSPENDNALKYCIVASFILHILFFAAITKDVLPGSVKSLAKPKENVTSVRLVTPKEPPKEKEPPPKHASAISDRDHTAKKERLAKMPPGQSAPLGRMVPSQQKLSALKPPPAPEDLLRPKEKEIEEPKRAKPDKTEEIRQKKRREPQPMTRTARPPPRPRDLRNLDVDLRPTPQEIARGLTPHAGSDDYHPDGDPEEVVVDINTRDNKFFSYLNHLKTKIQGVWVYPSSAARAGIGGTLTIEFVVERSGNLVLVNLLDSSGHAILDESAMRAIKAAAPYFPFPSRLTAKRIRIRANFHYITGDFFRRVL